LFQTGLRTTLILATVAAIASPLLFSVVAYMLVRTRWRGRTILDSIIWLSAAIPGIIASLGLLIMFLSTPGLAWLYGSIWALIIVVIISGNTTGTNLFKGVMVQLGKDMEEAARVSGAGWLRTYFKVVIPVLMPTMILIGTLNFVQAAGATASIILLASRETITLSILALQWGSDEPPRREAASIVSIIILVFTLGVAMVARHFGLKVGIRHDQRAGDEQPARQAEPEPSRAAR
jgi:iron(III) transport system permease protein